MSQLDFVNLYVADAEKSAGLYNQLLGAKPVSASPAFAMYILPNGLKFGLWARSDVQPPATGAGGAEICFAVDGDAGRPRPRSLEETRPQHHPAAHEDGFRPDLHRRGPRRQPPAPVRPVAALTASS